MKSNQLYFEQLSWDSEFFGFPVAKILVEIPDPETWSRVSGLLADSGIRLAYFATPGKHDWLLSGSSQFEVRLADHKLTYVKEIDSLHGNLDPQVQPYESSVPDEQMVKLAIESGVYSRYKRDLSFEPGSYQKLYELWIRNSVNKSIAEEVLVFREGIQIAGMVTLGIKNGRGDIGIIAVDEAFRGKGIASRLISAAESWCISRNLRQIQVVTQGDNEPACKLYEHCGYQLESTFYFYHIWNRM